MDLITPKAKNNSGATCLRIPLDRCRRQDPGLRLSLRGCAINGTFFSRYLGYFRLLCWPKLFWSGVTFNSARHQPICTFSQLLKSDVRLDSNDASRCPSYIADEEWRQKGIPLRWKAAGGCLNAEFGEDCFLIRIEQPLQADGFSETPLGIVYISVIYLK